MHEDLARRYQSVEALSRDIAHYQKGEPLEARPDTVGYRAGKFVRRHWRAVSATAAVLTLIVGLVTFYTVRLASARNAALTEAARAQRIQGLMLNLFTGGEEAAGPAEDLRVVSLIDRGVLEAENLNAEPAVQVSMYRTLGGIYQRLGNLTKAESLLQTSLDRRRALFGPDHPEVAESLVAMGLLRVGQAKLDEAERLVREGLEMSRRIFPPTTPLSLARQLRSAWCSRSVVPTRTRLRRSRRPRACTRRGSRRAPTSRPPCASCSTRSSTLAISRPPTRSAAASWR